MKYLKIQNDGILDIRLVALMGGTTKSKDEYKIGQFGTGLKYTLAFLYRNNLDFKIFCGTEEVKLHTEREEIRGEEFEIICINGQRTSITTRMGEDWEAWMIVRELWCNALDEGGAERCDTSYPVGLDGKTAFYIQIDRQIQTVLDNWGKYFIHDVTPICKNGIYTLYPAGEHLCLYKQGVLIKEYEGHKAMFNYDIATATINELREYKGYTDWDVSRALKAISDVKTCKYFLEHINDDLYEAKIDYNCYSNWEGAWKETIGTAKIIYPEVLAEIKARGGKPDEATLIVVPKRVYDTLTDRFEGIGAVTLASKLGNFYEDFNEEMESKVNQALTILEHCGYVIHPELTFTFGFFEDKTTLAQIHREEKKIYIHNTLLQKPLFTIVAMLVEENEHFNTGLSDETREFQQHFIDLYTRALLAKSEVEI
jgi:hypothetical protein